MPTHLFAVGQRVRIKNGMFVQRSAETYLVTAKLPPRGDLLQYRIRHDEERHDRVMTEDGLELASQADPVESTTATAKSGLGRG